MEKKGGIANVSERSIPVPEFPGALIDKTTMLLSNRNYITKTTQEHLRKKVNPDAEDETIEVKIECPYECSNNQLIQFLSHIMVEKEKLTAAISAAKRSCDIDIDGELANNRVRQRVARVLGDMAKIRPSENIIRGSAYKFNGEGNQVTYNYDVKQVTTIDFEPQQGTGNLPFPGECVRQYLNQHRQGHGGA